MFLVYFLDECPLRLLKSFLNSFDRGALANNDLIAPGASNVPMSRVRSRQFRTKASKKFSISSTEKHSILLSDS